MYDKCSSSASLALYLGNWVHILLYISWNRNKLFPCSIKKVPFPALLACPPVSRLPLPQNLPLVEIPPALLSRGCTGGWLGAAQGQRLAALARPQGPVPACANFPPRAWISLICKISTLFQTMWKSITHAGKTVETGKNGKEHFILCKPLICCDDPVRWWALSPSLGARYLQSQWMPPQTE